MFTILSAVAEAERDRIRERVSDMKADQRQRGRYLGGCVPYGFQAVPDESGNGKRLMPIPEQQRHIATMCRLRAEGLSLRKIQAHLAAEGVKLNHSTIGTALAQPSEAGRGPC